VRHVPAVIDLGQSYLPDEVKDAIRRPFAALVARSKV